MPDRLIASRVTWLYSRCVSVPLAVIDIQLLGFFGTTAAEGGSGSTQSSAKLSERLRGAAADTPEPWRVLAHTGGPRVRIDTRVKWPTIGDPPIVRVVGSSDRWRVDQSVDVGNTISPGRLIRQETGAFACRPSCARICHMC